MVGTSNYTEGGRCAGLNYPPPKEVWLLIISVPKALSRFRGIVDDKIAAKVTFAFRYFRNNNCIGGPSIKL